MPNTRALVVAINDYGGDGSNNLPSCINDANTFTDEVLKQPAFAFDQIHTLLDAEATVAKVQAELDWLVKDARPDDRLVFYFSGHGYTQLVNGVMEEYLVLRDGGGPVLFEDSKFVEKVKNLPGGVFTAVIDSCFSGGLFKPLVFGNTVEIALIKALPNPPEQIRQKALTFESVAGSETNKRIQLTGYRRFGCATRAPQAAAKMFSLGVSGPAKSLSDASEASQPEVSGLMVSACLETETAAASTSMTRGLSAFTFAFLDVIQHQPSGASAAALFNAAGSRLKALNFRQTPMLLERETPGNLKDRPFLGLSATQQKAFALPGTADEKLFGGLMGRLVQVIPQIAPIVFDTIAGRRKALEPGQPTLGSSQEASDEKFIGAILGTLAQAMPHVAPILADALSTRRKAFMTAGAAPAESDEKFIASILNTFAQVIPQVAPVIIESVSGRRKALEGVAPFGQTAEAQADEKFLGAVLGAVARTIPMVAPVITQAISGRRKELEGQAATATVSLQVDEKFLGAVLGTLAQVLPQVAPLVIDAVAGRRKGLGAVAGGVAITDEPDEKFITDCFNTISAAIPFIVPRIVDAVAGRPKALEGVSSLASVEGEADEKFLGAVVGTLAQVIPHVAPMIIDAFAGQRKEALVASGVSTGASQVQAQADEKFFGAVVAGLATVIPHVAPLIVNAVRGRRKELEISIGGTAAVDEKFLGDILRAARQVLPCVAGIAPPIHIFAPERKALEIPFQQPAAGIGTEVDEKFLGAVLSTLGRVLPVVTPAILQAIGGQRKEFGGFQPATIGQPEADEKFFGAVLATLGQVLPIVAPAIVQAVGAQRKELGGFQPATLGAAEADEKFFGAVLSTLGRVLPVVTPAILQAIGSQRKELTGFQPASTTTTPLEMDEKFLGAVLSTLGRVLPIVAPAVLQAIGGGRKEITTAPATGAFSSEVDEKFISAIVGRLQQTMPQWFTTPTAYRTGAGLF